MLLLCEFSDTRLCIVGNRTPKNTANQDQLMLLVAGWY